MNSRGKTGTNQRHNHQQGRKTQGTFHGWHHPNCFPDVAQLVDQTTGTDGEARFAPAVESRRDPSLDWVWTRWFVNPTPLPRWTQRIWQRSPKCYKLETWRNSGEAIIAASGISGLFSRRLPDADFLDSGAFQAGAPKRVRRSSCFGATRGGRCVSTKIGTWNS